MLFAVFVYTCFGKEAGKLKLSICMMVKNEEPNLKRCLESIQPLMNTIETELIIVDTGSTDNTVEIAKKYTEHVYYKEWFDDFSGMRNHTISFATGDWILILDADEEMIGSEKLGVLLPKIKNPDIKIVSMYVHSVINDDVDLIAPANSARVFRKGNIQYKGIVHNMPITSGDVYPSDIKLLHYGYLATDEELIKRKVNRTVTLLLKALEDEPNSEYYHFQLSQSYVMGKDVENAYLSAKKAYDLLNGKCSKAYIYIYAQYIKTLKMKSMFVELIRVSEEIFNVDDTHPDILFDYGMALLMMKRPEKSIQFLKRYLYVLDYKEDFEIFLDLSLTFGTTNDGNRDQAMYGIASAYLDMNDFKTSIAYFKQTIKDENLNYFIFTFAEATLDAPWTAHYFFELRNIIYDDLLESDKRLIDGYIEKAYRQNFNHSINHLENIIGYLKEDRLYDVIFLKRIDPNYQVKSTVIDKIFELKKENIRPYYGELIYYYADFQNIDVRKLESKKISLYNYITGEYKDGAEFICLLEKENLDLQVSLIDYFNDDDELIDVSIYSSIILSALEDNRLQIKYFENISQNLLNRLFNEIGVNLIDKNLSIRLLDLLRLDDDLLDVIFLKNKVLSAFVMGSQNSTNQEVNKKIFECLADNFSIEAIYKYNSENYLSLIDLIDNKIEVMKLRFLEYSATNNFKEKGRILGSLGKEVPQINYLLISEMESLIQEHNYTEIANLNNKLTELMNNKLYEEMAALFREMHLSNKYNQKSYQIMAGAFSSVGDQEMADALIMQMKEEFEC